MDWNEYWNGFLIGELPAVFLSVPSLLVLKVDYLILGGEDGVRWQPERPACSRPKWRRCVAMISPFRGSLEGRGSGSISCCG